MKAVIWPVTVKDPALFAVQEADDPLEIKSDRGRASAKRAEVEERRQQNLTRALKSHPFQDRGYQAPGAPPTAIFAAHEP
jgi:hypothetical protein